jgi:hypothetical protein
MKFETTKHCIEKQTFAAAGKKRSLWDDFEELEFFDA